MKHRGDSGRPTERSSGRRALKIEQVEIIMNGRSRKYIAIVSSMKKKWRVLMCKLECMRAPRHRAAGSNAN